MTNAPRSFANGHDGLVVLQQATARPTDSDVGFETAHVPSMGQATLRVLNGRGYAVPEQAWLPTERKGIVSRETLKPGVERMELADCTVVRVEPDVAFEWNDPVLAQAMRPTGVTLLHVPRRSMTKDDFMERCPSHTELIDGVWYGDPIATIKNEKGVRRRTDHHGRDRDAYPSASMQAYRDIVDGTDGDFAVDAQGNQRRLVVVNHLDADSIAGLYARLNHANIRDGNARTTTDRLYGDIDALDIEMGATLQVTPERTADVNWIFDDRSMFDDESLSSAEQDALYVDACLGRFDMAVSGRGGKVDVDFRHGRDYLVHARHGTWATVSEERTPLIRRKLLEEGFGAALIVKKHDQRGEKHSYSLQRLSKSSTFPLDEDMYRFLNFVDSLPDGRVQETLASLVPKDANVKVPREALDHSALISASRSFNGSNRIAVAVTSKSWETFDAALAWYLGHETNRPSVDINHFVAKRRPKLKKLLLMNR